MGSLKKFYNVTTVDSFDCLDENNKPKEADENAMDLIFLLDKSGSMHNLVDDTIGGFNSYIEREKSKEENILVTLVLFDDEYKMLYSRKPIDEVKDLTREDYYAGGCTALLDAIGKTINSFDKELNNKVLFVITTDGLENSSKEFSKSQIKELIESLDWEFLFIGADIDAYSEAMTLGIDAGHTAKYSKTAKGLGALFDGVHRYRCAYSENRESKDWKKDLD